VPLLVANAVNAEGCREILGICEGAKEDKPGWPAYLRYLVDRGLSGVRLIIPDACRGLVRSIAGFLPERTIQNSVLGPVSFRRSESVLRTEWRTGFPPRPIYAAAVSNPRPLC